MRLIIWLSIQLMLPLLDTGYIPHRLQKITKTRKNSKLSLGC